MKAIVLERTAPDGAGLELRELERPEPAEGEILVRVRAAGVNPVDVKTAAGSSRRFGSPPFVLGWDIAGTAETAGEGFEVGEEVLGLIRFPDIAGAYAEYAAAPVAELVTKPPELDFETAGGLPLAGLTAAQALDVAGLAREERVLVHAAAGGVGHLAVQLAKLAGAYVIGTAGAANHELLRELGVDEPIDYKSERFEERVSDADVVIETIGAENALRSLRCLNPGGRMVVIVGGLSDELQAAAEQARVKVMQHLVYPDAERLGRLVDHVAAGRLRVLIDRKFSLAEARAAHAYSAQGHARGKIVLEVG